MFKVPVEKHGINGHLRQKGKIAELALDYGGSVGALKAMGALEMELTEEELSYFKRGRNAKTVSMAKHATMHDYRHATGFEALMGYLYLTDQMKRMIDLIKIGMERTGGTP